MGKVTMGKLDSAEQMSALTDLETEQQHPDFAIILPTYCEAESIRNLIEDIKVLTNAYIIVVDDSSPDGTSEIVKKLMDMHENIALIERPAKLGLGSAIMDGFRFSLQINPPPKYIVTMDADFSNAPRDILKLVSAAKQGWDLVIGSRYCKGSRIIRSRSTVPIFRRVLNIAVSFVFGLDVSDSTSGFRCYSSRFVENILPRLRSETYEIEIETLKQAKEKRFHTVEMPIRFEDRKMGKQKLSFSRFVKLMSLLLLGRRDHVIEDNKIKVGIERMNKITTEWKSIVDDQLTKRKLQDALKKKRNTYSNGAR